MSPSEPESRESLEWGFTSDFDFWGSSVASFRCMQLTGSTDPLCGTEKVSRTACRPWLYRVCEAWIRCEV